MDIAQLCSILAACISQNPQQRKAAEVTLAQVRVFMSNYCNITVQVDLERAWNPLYISIHRALIFS